MRNSEKAATSSLKLRFDRLTLWINLLKNFFTILYKNPVRTSQETHYVSTTKPNRLMLFGETVAVYCENNTEHTYTLFGQNAVFLMLKQVVHIVTI
jgi:hypothetical protein